MYNVNINKLILDQLPQAVRTLFNFTVQKWWLKPVSNIHDAARKQGVTLFDWGCTTAQIGSLAEYLNGYFDPLGGNIHITDAEWVEEEYLFMDGEPYEDLILWTDAEDISLIEGAEEIYLYTDTEINTYQFIVWIPESLNTPQMIEQITSSVNEHIFFGKDFIIQVIE